MLEARTQASVALFKLGAHSATLRPEFGGPKSLRCCCAKGVGHRAQLMLRARRGARENDYPVPLLRTPTPQKLSLSCPHSEHRGGSQLPSLSTSCHVADRERISSCSARRVAKAKVLPEPPGALRRLAWRRSCFDLYFSCRDARGGALWGGAVPNLARYFQPAVGTADAVSPRLAPAGVTCLSSARSA